MEIISNIVEVVKEFWEHLSPFYIVKEYEHGVLLRFGKFHSKVSAGLVWKIPLVDDILTARNSITTIPIQEQSLTTKDGKNVVISSIVKYKITNAKIFLLEVDDALDAINDITKGKIKELVINRTWEEVKQLKDTELIEPIAEEVKNWGIKVYYITITDLALVKTIRLMGVGKSIFERN